MVFKDIFDYLNEQNHQDLVIHRSIDSILEEIESFKK
jgi:hypothetical protein